MSAVEPIGPVTQPTQPTAVALRTNRVVAQILPLKERLGTALTRSGPMLVYQMNRIGRTGAAGAAMLLFAVIFFFSALLPQRQQLMALEHQIQLAHRPGGLAETAPVRLSRFMSSLPRRSELPTVVGQVFTLAATANVTLDRGRYELSPVRGGNLAQYRMTFPIKGHYPDIRQFIDSVLTAIPSAAVEGMRIERKAVGDDNVAADLRFSVFVRNDS